MRILVPAATGAPDRVSIQKLPDAQMAQIISDGKGGMPSFKGSLSEEQIHSLVVHIRSLHQKK